MKEINLKNIITVENVGTGAGIYSNKTNGNNLQFKSISATGTSIQIINTANEIYISGATGGGSSGITYVCVDVQNNTFTCINPLTNLTTGSMNIAMGYLALSANTTGEGNIGIGCSALYSNINGHYNIAQGIESLYSNISGRHNIGIGYVSLWCNTTGCDNVALGQSSLNGNVSGCYNIGLGCSSLLVNSSGNDNIGVGKKTLYNNCIGNINIAIGDSSLFCNTTGSYNVAISECALYNNKTGQNNIAIGDFAMYNNTGGTCNIGIGLEALYSNISGNGNISIGVDNLINSVSGCDNIALGNLSANALISGNNNIFLGNYAGNGETGSNKLHVGSIINKSLIYGEFDNEKLCIRGQTYISGLTNSCNSNLIYYNNSTNELTYGVSCYLPLTGGTVSGCITAVNFILSSDCRLKENIRPITISEIDTVGMVEFNYISDETKHLRYGILAQDLEKIHPEMVYENKEGFKEVAYIDYLVAKINSMEKRINILESKLL